MKKRVALVAFGENTRRVVVDQLQEVLGGMVAIEAHAVEAGMPARIQADLVLFTHYSVVDEVPGYDWGGSSMLSARRMVNFAYIDQLLRIPPGSHVLLVNDTPETARETVELLQGLGLDHIRYTPFYPGAPAVAADLAITPGEVQYVPGHIKRVINLGPRLIDYTTLVEVLQRLGLLDERANVVTARYMREMVRRGRQLAENNRELASARGQLETILRMVDQGVVAVDGDGNVIFANPRAREILGDDVSPLNLPRTALSGRAETGRIYDLDERQIVVSKVPFQSGDGPSGAVATLREAREIQDIEHRLRRGKSCPGLAAKYSFAEIIGESGAMQEAKRRAIRIAESDATVLIQGESGTGKELFAQAIHLASPRHDQPFVAINCAALPETLLESELFGYEEGSFTGARKGGKPGLFELAHQGTMFLDEIGETPLPLQARLLRVLQEKEVMRIGGTRVIPVDVRVIAATHRNLEKLRQEGRFRDDLYYRLNVLPLVLPPLRERVEDIPFLAEALWRNLARQQVWPYRRLSPDIAGILGRYSWPGNVRELENALAYAMNMAKGVPQADDLPPYLTAQAVPSPNTGLSELDIRILRLLAQGGPSRGRRSIAGCLTDGTGGPTEAEIRARLRFLAREGLVDPGRGRKGTGLTEQGLEVLRKWA